MDKKAKYYKAINLVYEIETNRGYQDEPQQVFYQLETVSMVALYDRDINFTDFEKIALYINRVKKRYQAWFDSHK